MSRSLHRLSAVSVTGRKKPGYYADGGGLYLRVAPGGSKGWVFRFARAGKTREAGLGGCASVTLAAAREAAQKCRQLVASGLDPIVVRRAEDEAQRLAASKATTFEAFANSYMTAHEPAWRNAKHAAQWRSTMKTYVYPAMGAVAVGDVTTEHILKVLSPIWAVKPETASRVRGRIESILDAARASGLRGGENPARWRGHLDHLLPAKSKVRRVKHHPALAFAEIPQFMANLRQLTGVSARALEFLILTATRTNEALGASFVEIEADCSLWAIPAERMKGGRAHRVPLSERAVAIVREMAEVKQNELLFPGAKPGRPLSQMAMLMLLRRMGCAHVTVHGFRSTFRDWAAEHTQFPNEVCEMALAHVVDDETEAAYRRGDLFERRRKLMAAWERYCTSQTEGSAGKGALQSRQDRQHRQDFALGRLAELREERP